MYQKQNEGAEICINENFLHTLPNKKRLHSTFETASFSGEVPRTGIEPALPCDNQILSLARLPVPPSGLGAAILRHPV